VRLGLNENRIVVVVVVEVVLLLLLFAMVVDVKSQFVTIFRNLTKLSV
jgi:hypothetical protein